PEGAEHVPEAVLLRHREFQPGCARARDRFHRRRSRARRQRLPAPDWQHPVDARRDREAADHRRRARTDPLEERRAAARPRREGPMMWKRPGAAIALCTLLVSGPTVRLTRDITEKVAG